MQDRTSKELVFAIHDVLLYSVLTKCEHPMFKNTNETKRTSEDEEDQKDLVTTNNKTRIKHPRFFKSPHFLRTLVDFGGSKASPRICELCIPWAMVQRFVPGLRARASFRTKGKTQSGWYEIGAAEVRFVWVSGCGQRIAGL